MIPRRLDREDIKAAVRRSGSSLKALSNQAGLDRATCAKALVTPIPAANKAIADFLGSSLHRLWPQWYRPNGQRKLENSRHRSQSASRVNLKASRAGGTQ